VGRPIKGRGTAIEGDVEQNERYGGKAGVWEEIPTDNQEGGPQKSIEGWIIFVTGVHEEATEDMVHDKFADYGIIKNIQVPLDRRTGFVKGYALIEYENKAHAQSAIQGANGGKFMEHTLGVDWAFHSQPLKRTENRRTGKKGRN